MSEINSDDTSAFVATSSDAPEPAQVTEHDVPATKEVEAASGESEAKEEAEGKQDEEQVKAGESNDSDTTAEQEGKKPRSAQKRIDKVVREREDAKRELEAAQRRIQELEAKKEANTDNQGKEPVESDFETYDDYLTALDKYDSSAQDEPKGEEPANKDDQTSDSSQLTDAQRTAMGIIGEKTADAADKHPDFEKVALAPEVPITGDMLEALAECDDPATVMMHLGNNKDLATEIAGKSPAQQMREIAKLDLTVSYTPPKPIKTTQAADPISPVSGSDAQQKPVHEMSFKEHEAHMNELERKSTGSRW